MYKPEDMEIPRAFTDEDWVMPDYIRLAEEARAEDPTLGQKMGYSLAVSAREAQEARALTCGMITMVDDAIGRVRAAADQAGLADDTVQIFTSDHGDHHGDHRLLFKGTEQYDTITHVPFIWSDPKGATGTLSDELGQTLDIGTTIGARPHRSPRRHAGSAVRGRWMAGRRLSSSTKPSARRRPSARHRAPTPSSATAGGSTYRGKAQNELFDPDTDPDEMVNLWDHERFQEVKASLIEQLAELEIDVINSAVPDFRSLITGRTCLPRPLSVSSSLR